MPRAVLGGFFLLVCGMIAVSGLRLLATARDTLENSAVIGASLIPALTVPVYVRTALPDWLGSRPPLAQLLLTNTVVLAMLLAIGFNLVLNVLRGEAEDGAPPESSPSG